MLLSLRLIVPLLLLPIASSLLVSHCDRCPPSMKCVSESARIKRCECTEGWFTKSVLVEALVDLSPAEFISSRGQLLEELSAFVNKTVTVYYQAGHDRIFTLDQGWNRVPVLNSTLSKSNATFVDVDFFLELAECHQSYYDLDRYTKKVRFFVRRFAEAKKLNDSLTTTTTPSPSPPAAALPDFAPITFKAFRNPVSIAMIAFVAALLVLLVISVICCVCMKKSAKKRTHYVEDLEESLVLPTISRSNPHNYIPALLRFFGPAFSRRVSSPYNSHSPLSPHSERLLTGPKTEEAPIFPKMDMDCFMMSMRRGFDVIPIHAYIDVVICMALIGYILRNEWLRTNYTNFAIIMLARAYIAAGTILFDNFDRGFYCTTWPLIIRLIVHSSFVCMGALQAIVLALILRYYEFTNRQLGKWIPVVVPVAFSVIPVVSAIVYLPGPWITISEHIRCITGLLSIAIATFSIMKGQKLSSFTITGNTFPLLVIIHEVFYVPGEYIKWMPFSNPTLHVFSQEIDGFGLWITIAVAAVLFHRELKSRSTAVPLAFDNVSFIA